MNEPLITTIDLCQSKGVDFNAMLAQCLAFGEVQSCGDYFCMGYPVGDGVFFVHMLAGDFMECARINAGRFDELHFTRDFKGSHRVRKFKLKRLNKYGKRINTTTPGK